MKDLIDKLADINKCDPNYDYTIEIKPTGAFVLHGLAARARFEPDPTKEYVKRIPCRDDQDLRTEMYRIILSLRK